MYKSIFLAVLLTTSGCSNAEPVRYVTASADYSKPGAPVELKYALMKTPTAGAPTSVALQLSSRVPVSRITTRVTVSNGMQLSKSPALDGQHMKAQAPLQDTLVVTPATDGRYYINVFVETEVDGNKLLRAFAIPVVVGNVAAETKPAPKTDAQGNPIVELPAERR